MPIEWVRGAVQRRLREIVGRNSDIEELTGFNGAEVSSTYGGSSESSPTGNATTKPELVGAELYKTLALKEVFDGLTTWNTRQTMKDCNPVTLSGGTYLPQSAAQENLFEMPEHVFGDEYFPDASSNTHPQYNPSLRWSTYVGGEIHPDRTVKFKTIPYEDMTPYETIVNPDALFVEGRKGVLTAGLAVLVENPLESMEESYLFAAGVIRGNNYDNMKNERTDLGGNLMSIMRKHDNDPDLSGRDGYVFELGRAVGISHSLMYPDVSLTIKRLISAAEHIGRDPASFKPLLEKLITPETFEESYHDDMVGNITGEIAEMRATLGDDSALFGSESIITFRGKEYRMIPPSERIVPFHKIGLMGYR